MVVFIQVAGATGSHQALLCEAALRRPAVIALGSMAISNVENQQVADKNIAGFN